MAWTTPRTWTAGEIVTAAMLNAHVRDNLNAVGGAWTSYTPTWTATTTNPSIGNGSITGAYLSAGKLTMFRLTLTIGSTTTFGSGGYLFSLPSPGVSTGYAYGTPLGTATCYDSSTSSLYPRQALLYSDTTKLHLFDQSNNRVNPTTPFTFATSDTISILGTYEAA